MLPPPSPPLGVSRENVNVQIQPFNVDLVDYILGSHFSTNLIYCYIQDALVERINSTLNVSSKFLRNQSLIIAGHSFIEESSLVMSFWNHRLVSVQNQTKITSTKINIGGGGCTIVFAVFPNFLKKFGPRGHTSLTSHWIRQCTYDAFKEHTVMLTYLATHIG